ncbi:MAG: hypothetical protein RR902_02965, partial [Oscillospiraceae bacterium]
MLRSYFKKNKIFSIVSFIFFALLMVLTIFVGETPFQADSPGYIYGAITRDPAYPLLISMFEFIFSENFVLPLLVFQNLLVTFAMWSFTLCLSEIFKLNKILTTTCLVGFFGMLSCFVFLSLSHSVLTSTILVEGVTISLFFIVLKYLLIAITQRQLKPLVFAAIFIFIAIFTRFQMAYLLVLWLIVAIYVSLCNKSFKRNILIFLFTFIAIFVGTSLGAKTYHYIMNDHFVSTQFKDTSFMAKLIFISDENDKNLFAKNSTEQKCFDEIYSRAKTQEILKSNADKGFTNSFLQFEYSYD